MIKVTAIGDLHAEFPRLWRALRGAYLAGEDFLPSEPVQEGRFRVVLMGDLMHPKTLEHYQRLTGLDDFNPKDPTHLRMAAKAQIREMYRIKRYQEAAPEHVTILLGNHDHAAATGEFVLGNAYLEHYEFHPEHGGITMPEDLKAWLLSFPTEINLYGVNFSHVGPVPWLQTYDAMFYNGREAKEWWQHNPDYVSRMGYRFGVYGHTVMKEGIQILDQLALIDAFDQDQYLVLYLDDDHFEVQIAHVQPLPLQ